MENTLAFGIKHIARSLSTMVCIVAVPLLLTGCGKKIVPGSEVKVQIGGMLHSIDGQWRGEILGVKTQPIFVDGKKVEWSFSNVHSQQDKWPRSYSVATKAPAGNSYPWIKAVLPNDSRLCGKTLRATVTFKVTWPVGASGEVPFVAMGEVKDKSIVVTEEIEIKVAEL